MKATVIGIGQIFSPAGLNDLFQKVTGQEAFEKACARVWPTRPIPMKAILFIG